MISKNKNLLRIALAQCNSYLGDVNKNIETIEDVVNQVINKKIDIGIKFNFEPLIKIMEYLKKIGYFLI